MVFWTALILGTIGTAIPAYISYGKNKEKNKKKAITTTIIITVCGVVTAITLAIVANTIYDIIKTQTDDDVSIDSGSSSIDNSSSETTSSSSSSTPVENTTSSLSSPNSTGSTDESISSSTPTSSNTLLNVLLNPNEGTISYKPITVYFGGYYPELKTPRRDYYTFAGWYTSKEGGYKVEEGDMVDNPNSHTLYAHWVKNPEKWDESSKVPADANIIDEKWKYVLTETKESTNSYESGWTQTGSLWKQTNTGIHTYADFPSNSDGKVYYNTSDQFYKIYNNGAYKNFENENTKREITNEQIEAYIYYHWVYPLSGNHSENDRIIGSYNGEKIYNRDGTYCGAASIWESFKGVYIEYKPEKKAYKAIGNSTYSYWWSGGIPIYTQTYTDYEKIYLYKRETANESSSEIVEGGGISNVQKYVKYQEK